MGRTWYAPWSSASAYAPPIRVGAKMTQMENRIVLTRFKDGHGPVGTYFLHLKTYTQNGLGEEYEKRWYDDTKALVGDYIDRHPAPTCLRNHAILKELAAGRGPIRMVTKEAFQDPHKETVRQENFLGLLLGHHAHSPPPDFLRIPLRRFHDSILSKVGVSGKPGAIQNALLGMRGASGASRECGE